MQETNSETHTNRGTHIYSNTIPKTQHTQTHKQEHKHTNTNTNGTKTDTHTYLYTKRHRFTHLHPKYI